MAACPLPGATISGTPADESQIGIADNGTAIAVWREFDGVNTLIKSAFLIKGGSWSSPVTITSFNGNDTNASPQIAVSGSSGNAVAIWEQIDTGSSTSFVYASVRPANTGIWTSPVQIDTGDTNSGDRLQQIAINTVGSDDYAVAIWVTDNGVNTFLESAWLNIIGFIPGSWSSPVEVVPSTPDSLIFPGIVVDTTGIAYAIWGNVSNFSIQTAILTFNGLVWSSPVTLSPGLPGERYLQPKIALGSTGFVAATWRQRTAVATFFVQATTYQTGSWDLTPDTISAGSTSAGNLDMDADLTNNVIALWREGIGPTETIKSAYRPFVSGIWGSPLQASSLGVPSNIPDVTLISGTAYAVWTSLVGGFEIIEFATSNNGSAWSAPCTNISPPTDNSAFAHIVLDPSEYGVIVWDNLTIPAVQATSLILPPTVTAVSPTSGSLNGQNSVLITGTNFIYVQSVEFGAGNFAPSFIVISQTEILAVAPSGPLAPPSVDVIVTTSTGSSPANPPGDLYSFINPICWQR